MASVSSPRVPNSQSYPSAARLSDSLCFPQYTASLKCNFFVSFLSSFLFSHALV
ncbi:hypothetical protein MA16_Dca003417 [Dendrobium catenatum]|uniref:Uncharacterized protein n=1 Tax=Dendrobium catenatum TaxID=906689 RepID=A0A2I0XCQ2_9ASPA|nr:hypothetical protein MA16_Dca003417 [Dendrobium catenatum]